VAKPLSETRLLSQMGDAHRAWASWETDAQLPVNKGLPASERHGFTAPLV